MGNNNNCFGFRQGVLIYLVSYQLYVWCVLLINRMLFTSFSCSEFSHPTPDGLKISNMLNLGTWLFISSKFLGVQEAQKLNYLGFRNHTWPHAYRAWFPQMFTTLTIFLQILYIFQSKTVRTNENIFLGNGSVKYCDLW